MRCHTNGLPFGLAGDFPLDVELIPWRGRIRAMATAVTVRADFSTDELRRLAAASKHANQSRRLLSLAAVLDGMSRADAARIGGMDRQTLRDWVHRFNERGPEGLKDSWSKGHPPRLSGEPLAQLAEVVETGPERAVHGLLRWRRVDLQQVVAERFGVNPVIGTNRAADERSRDRVLSDEELAIVWGACRDDDFGRIVRLLILTGQRREEVGGMKRSELDFVKGVGSIPGDRTKNGRMHEVPLAASAAELLPQASLGLRCGFLFGEAKGPFQGWSKAKAALERRILSGG